MSIRFLCDCLVVADLGVPSDHPAALLLLLRVIAPLDQLLFLISMPGSNEENDDEVRTLISSSLRMNAAKLPMVPFGGGRAAEDQIWPLQMSVMQMPPFVDVPPLLQARKKDECPGDAGDADIGARGPVVVLL